MKNVAIDQVRSFNRTVTEGIGVLDSHFMGRDRPVGEARLLWEIGANGVEVRALRARLGLDSGYVSRVLRSLERHKLARVRTSRRDGRVRHVYLTPRGLAERSELDRLSNALASRILDPLNQRQRTRLLAAMTDVERLIEASMVRFAIEDPDSADATSCFAQYFAELNERFEEGFDPELSLPARVDELTPPAGALVIARSWTSDWLWRGEMSSTRARSCSPHVGVARRTGSRSWTTPLLHELEQFARASGAKRIRLDTHRSLKEAIALYRRSGYREVKPFSDERYGDHWFEKRL